MKDPKERAISRSLWTAVLLTEGWALWVVIQALTFQPVSRACPKPLDRKASAELASEGVRAEAVKALMERRLSRAITKPPPPATPPVSKAPLDTLVRLSGIVDYGAGSPPEAIIEFMPLTQSKSYKAGDLIATTEARVTRIDQTVEIDYDGRSWVLAFTGVKESPSSNDKPTPASPEGGKR